MALAKDCFFGVSVMYRSSVEGRTREQLDPNKMKIIKLILRQHVCPNDSEETFETMWMEMKKNIGQACSQIRRKYCC